MWKEEGFAGFMKGNGINVVRVGLVNADVDSDRHRLIRADITILRHSILGTFVPHTSQRL